MIDGMITVRSQSTRLPEKCFLPFGGGNVIEHMIRRAKHFEINPIVCTTIEESDDKIVEIAKAEGVRYFRGSVKDKLDRWNKASAKFNIDTPILCSASDKESASICWSDFLNLFVRSEFSCFDSSILLR